MRIVMVEPDTDGIHIFKKFRLPRIGAVLLATILDRAGHDVDVEIEVAAPIDRESLRRADLVGISTITPTATRSYALADELRAEGVPVVMGGPHVTFRPDEAMSHADWVVRGEGEAAITALVDVLDVGATEERLATVPNLTWRRGDGTLAHNPMAPPAVLDDLPSPDWSLVRAGVEPDGGVDGTLVVQTSRGCAYDCSFCSVTELFGRKMRWRSVDKVVAEARRANRRGDIVFFYDDHFTASRARTRELCEALIAAKIPNFRFCAQVRADVARDPELLALMRRAGADTFFIGLESADPETLAAMNKGQKVEDMRRDVQAILAAGIKVHGMFVLGTDTDTQTSIDKTVQFAVDARITSAQFLILMPLPGTRVWDQMERDGRIHPEPWSHYDGHHVTFRPKNLTPMELQQAQLRAHGRFYAWPRLLGWLARGRVVPAAIAFYAKRLNDAWPRKKGEYLERLAYRSGAMQRGGRRATVRHLDAAPRGAGSAR